MFSTEAVILHLRFRIGSRKALTLSLSIQLEDSVHQMQIRKTGYIIIRFHKYTENIGSPYGGGRPAGRWTFCLNIQCLIRCGLRPTTNFCSIFNAEQMTYNNLSITLNFLWKYEHLPNLSKSH